MKLDWCILGGNGGGEPWVTGGFGVGTTAVMIESEGAVEWEERARFTGWRMLGTGCGGDDCA